MRVLGVFSTNQLLGGGEVSFALSLRGLQDNGCEVLALLPDHGPLFDHLLGVGIRCQIAPQTSFRRGGSVQFLLRPHPVWIEAVRAFEPDVIHCNAIRSALYGQAVGRSLSIPVVFHARTAQKDPPFDQFLMATTSAIVCTSQVVKERFPTWFGAEKLTVISNPIDPAFLESKAGQEMELRSEWLGTAPGPLIGVIGRLSPAKGQNLVVESAPEILRHHPSCRFVLIGGGDSLYPEYASRLEAKLRASGCEEAFVFAGFQSDMRSAYRALDIVAFPTLAEGFGRVLIEAGALSKPIVATDLHVFREIMPPALRKHFLAEPGEFASRLIDLIDAESLSSAAARELHNHVVANYSLDRHVEHLTQLYRRLTRGDLT